MLRHRHLPKILAVTAAAAPVAAVPQLAAAASATHTYAGPGVTMRWGTVRVTLTVKGKKIVKVTAVAPTERARSAFINQQAVPFLDHEVLKAQGAKINGLGGATLTSNAFYQSLLSALHAAHL